MVRKYIVYICIMVFWC